MRPEVKLNTQDHTANVHKIGIPKDQKSLVTFLVPLELALYLSRVKLTREGE